MAKVEEAVVAAKVAKKAASTLFAGRAAFGGAKVAAVLLTGLTGGAGYLGYQFVNSPSVDLSKPEATAEADQKPGLIPSAFADNKPARLLGANDGAATPWGSSKEAAPAAENPWAKQGGSLVDDGARSTTADPGRRTFLPDASAPVAQVDSPAPFNSTAPRWGADTRPTLPNDVASPPARMPSSPAPITSSPPSLPISNSGNGLSGGNSLRSTSPSLPSTGNMLDNRQRPLATTPNLSTSTPNTSTSSPTTTAMQDGQRMMRCVNPCCPNVVMCVPVNPCCPPKCATTQTSSPTPATGSRQASPPIKLSAAGGKNSPIRVAAYEAESQPATEIVLPQDSYWIITERVYGDGEYYKALQEHHLRRGVRRLEIGDELTIPSIATLRRQYPELCPVEHPGSETRGIPLANVSRTNLRRLYVVSDGDTLRSIAARELGDADRSGEIADLNRAALEKAGFLRADLEIVLPAR